MGTSICISILWLVAFTLIKCFPMMALLLGMHGSMYVFTGFCLAGAAFILGMLPETKGKSLDEIVQLMEK